MHGGYFKGISPATQKEGIRLVIDASKVAGTEVPEEFVKSHAFFYYYTGRTLGRMKEGQVQYAWRVSDR